MPPSKTPRKETIQKALPSDLALCLRGNFEERRGGVLPSEKKKKKSRETRGPQKGTNKRGGTEGEN